jgi:hypothetical protein
MIGVLYFLFSVMIVENVIIIYLLLQSPKLQETEYITFKGRDENPPPQRKNLVNKQYDRMRKRR